VKQFFDSLLSSQSALEKDGSISLTPHFSAWHYPQRLRLNSTVSNSCKRNFKAPHGKLRQERHVYSNRSIKRPSSSVGAALFLVAEGGPVRHWSIERCRSYGAWPNSGVVLAIDMALLQELGAPPNQIPQSQKIRAIKLIGLTPRTARLPERIIRPEKGLQFSVHQGTLVPATSPPALGVGSWNIRQEASSCSKRPRSSFTPDRTANSGSETVA